MNDEQKFEGWVKTDDTVPQQDYLAPGAFESAVDGGHIAIDRANGSWVASLAQPLIREILTMEAIQKLKDTLKDFTGVKGQMYRMEPDYDGQGRVIALSLVSLTVPKTVNKEHRPEDGMERTGKLESISLGFDAEIVQQPERYGRVGANPPPVVKIDYTNKAMASWLKGREVFVKTQQTKGNDHDDDGA